jgi:hypothetical protein
MDKSLLFSDLVKAGTMKAKYTRWEKFAKDMAAVIGFSIQRSFENGEHLDLINTQTNRIECGVSLGRNSWKTLALHLSFIFASQVRGGVITVGHNIFRF